MYWRPLERDGFAAAVTEPADDAITAGASCFETALEMEWPALLERRDAVREIMVGLIWIVLEIMTSLAAMDAERMDGEAILRRLGLTPRSARRSYLSRPRISIMAEDTKKLQNLQIASKMYDPRALPSHHQPEYRTGIESRALAT